MSTEGGGQARDSVARNSEFFARDVYSTNADRIDSHVAIRSALTKELTGAKRLLDVGNGGVFEYDPAVVESLTAVDLFLDESDDSFPDNVTIRKGDALALEEEPASFDVVLEAFLYHHLTGAKAADSVDNVRKAISEAVRMVEPGGRLVIAESCIPARIYPLERALYRPLRALAATPMLGGHPATLQLPIELLVSLVEERARVERVERIELGKWVTQFGRRFPAKLTPVRAYLIVARCGG